jgi:Flp pilus assembly protein TadD
VYRQFVSTFYVGVAALQVGDDVRAESSLAHSTELVPGEPAGWADWGILALRQRSFDAAGERLIRAHQLAPNDDRIDYLLGLLEAARGNMNAAIAALREAIRQNPHNLRAMYRLTSEIERQGARNSDADIQVLLNQILKIRPDNLAVQLALCRVSAKRGDLQTLRSTVARIAALSHAWPLEAQQQLALLQADASGGDLHSAATRSTFLRNVLMRQPEFRASLSEVEAQPGEEAQPLTHFVRLQNPSSEPAAPDLAMSFTSEPFRFPLSEHGSAEKWSWIGAIAFNGDDPPIVAEVNSRHLRMANGVDLPFPGDANHGPSPEGVLAFDFNYDFKTDLLFAGSSGIRLFRQDASDKFTDVTAMMKLPKAVTAAPYARSWALDIEADGDLDVLLGGTTGIPTVLRNNGDGTFAVIHPFDEKNGVRQFVWADLNGDGDPDAALIDESGRLHIFINQRAGRFTESELPPAFLYSRAIAVAGTNQDGILRLYTVRADGSIVELSLDGSGSWTQREVAHLQDHLAGDIRLRAADLDNNGATDLMVLPVAGEDGSSSGASIWLQDAAGAFHLMAKPQGPALVFDTADLRGNGRLDLLGLATDGTGVLSRNQGAQKYYWQTIRPRARQTTGDQRINPFGIGGEIEIRSGLLVQKQSITGPDLHFGLGDHTTVDVARITWPNGSTRAEFNLKANMQIVTEQRLKGSCPFLFAWNGSRMAFVKDSVPWGSAIGLRINSLGTAKIAATEEWYKIGRDQLQPRDGYYDLRITGELWETYFYDSVKLMTVDHPADTEVFTDERYDVPPVKLSVVAVGHPQPIRHAVDDIGNDVTDVVRTLDGKYLDTFGRGQYQGVTRDHYVEIDLDDHVPHGAPLWLIAKGWLHPSDSTVNVAMSQGTHERPHWLSLEVPDGHGRWRIAKSNLGFPAGRNKICLIDLAGIFSANVPHRLRLRTNLEIYWDSIEWAEGLPNSPMKINQLKPVVADLRYRGFSVIHQANESSPELPDYDHLAGTSPQWRDLAGFYTRFGDVRELLSELDDRYVIMNAGDEMALRFAAPPPPPPGWVRDFVIDGDGWIKDGDYNSAYSKSVMPYPYHARRDYDSAPGRLEDDTEYRLHVQDWQTYHTRYVDSVAFRNALTTEGKP